MKKAREDRTRVVSIGDKTETGDNPHRAPRPGSHTDIGTVVSFVEQSSELTADAQYRLLTQIDGLAGLSHKIEIRGHTSRRPVVGDPILRDNWDLAFARCRKVMEFVETHGIDTRRIRMSVAGANEPLHTDADLFKLQKNPRVEIFVLGETVGDLTGSNNEP